VISINVKELPNRGASHPKNIQNILDVLRVRLEECTTRYFSSFGVGWEGRVQYDDVTLYIYEIGAGLGLHDDLIVGGKGVRIFSTLIYLNDDFTGGDLYFPSLDKKIRPVKNMVVSFHNGIHLPHMVIPVTEGVRLTANLDYTLPSSLI